MTYTSTYARDMSNSTVAVVQEFMRAFRAQDRAAAERVMAEDFVFTSPQDDHIDKATWLERCFPTAGHFSSPAHTLQIIPIDGLVLHRYEYAVDGALWRNVEALEVRDGLVHAVEVYFGGPVGRTADV